MAPRGAPFDLLAPLGAWVRRSLLGASTLALLSCGGGQSGPAPSDSTVEAAGAGTGGPGIELAVPRTVGASNRIGLAWQASSGLASFTVFVKRAQALEFEPVEASVDANSAQFERGASWRLDFPTARVRVRGCDASNQCVDSNEQPLLRALLTGVAQLGTGIDPPLGAAKLSADGNTLAVPALSDRPAEDNPACPGNIATGSVRVFHRAVDGRWTQEANLNRFAVPGPFGFRLALSGDGNTLVASATDDAGTVGGINAPEIGTVVPPHLPQDHRGAIHVYTRDAQRQWSHQAFIKPSVTVANEGFGNAIAVSHDGNRVLVGANDRVILFEREAGKWRQARIFGSAPGAVISIRGMAISANGSAIALRTVGGRQANGIELAPFAVRVYTPCPCGDGWQQVADLRSAKPMHSFVNEDFGTALSFSGDGNTLAVGAPGDPGDENDDGASVFTNSLDSGAVHIFATDGGGVWQRRAFLKARTAPTCDRLGTQVALSADGKVLAALASGRAANADGVRRNHRDGATAGHLCPHGIPVLLDGSGYVFEADASGSWSHTAAAIPAPGESISFISLALSADAQTMAFAFTLHPQVPPLRAEVPVY